MTPELRTVLQQFDSLCETISRVLQVNEGSTRIKKARTNPPVSRPAAKKG